MVTFPYEWKIRESDVKPQTYKRKNHFTKLGSYQANVVNNAEMKTRS